MNALILDSIDVLLLNGAGAGNLKGLIKGVLRDLQKFGCLVALVDVLDAWAAAKPLAIRRAPDMVVLGKNRAVATRTLHFLLLLIFTYKIHYNTIGQRNKKSSKVVNGHFQLEIQY